MLDAAKPQDFDPQAGTGVIDDRNAIQCAIDTGYCYLPWTPSGYRISSRLHVPGGCVLQGSLRRPTVNLMTSGEWLVEVGGSDVVIRGLKSIFDGLNSGGFVLLRSDQSPLERVKIDDHFISGATGVIHDLAGPHRIVHLKMDEILSYNTRGHGINLQTSVAYQYMNRCMVLYNGEYNFRGISSFRNEGSFYSNCDVTGGTVTPGNSANHGFYFENCQAVWMYDCMADMLGGGGFFLNGGCDHMYLNDCISSMVGTHGFSIVNGGSDITLKGCKAGGRKGMAYAPDMPGIYAANTPYVLLDDACKTYNTVGGALAGVQLPNCPGARNNAMMI